MNELRSELAPIHLQCECLRLQIEHFTWEAYADIVFSKALWDDFRSPRAWAKKAINISRRKRFPSKDCSIAARIGYSMLDLRGILPALFPVVVYKNDNSPCRQLVADCLHAQNTEEDELRRAYLFTWGSAVEPPFLQLARKWNLTLEAETST